MTLNTHKTTWSNQHKSFLTWYKTLALAWLLSLYWDQPVIAQTKSLDPLQTSIEYSDKALESNKTSQDITNILSYIPHDKVTQSLQDPYHPLVSNLFARWQSRNSLVDGLIANYQKIYPLIDKHGKDSIWNQWDGSSFLWAWAILESCLKANIVANPHSKNYNAAWLYQYIPDTRRIRYNRFKKVHPDIQIKNDRTDPLSNLLVTQYNLSVTQKSFDDKPDFALWAHHAGESRIKQYYIQYKQFTGQDPVSIMDRYNQILPREIVDQFMRLKDNSFIYVAQVVWAQSIYELLQQDPSQVQAIIDTYLLNQITDTKWSGIDDLNYSRNIDHDTSPLVQDSTLTSLLSYLSEVCELDIHQANTSQRNDRHRDNLSTSAILEWRWAKIFIPFKSSEVLRTSSSLTGIKYKRFRYMLELARIHGLCSIAYERLPGGELVNSIGLTSNVNAVDVEQFKTLTNRNKKPPQNEKESNVAQK